MKFIKWLISLFTPKKLPDVVIITPKNPLEEVPTKEEIDSFPKKKIAILIGHGAGDSGAICFNGIEEHAYNKQVAEYIESKLPVKLFFKTSSGWAPTYLKLAAFKPDISMELHLNSFNGKAMGCEVLCTSQKAKLLADSFNSKFSARFNRKNRGIKWLESGDRGYGNVKSASMLSGQAILIEAFFCDNKDEWIEPLTYAQFLVEWIHEL